MRAVLRERYIGRVFGWAASNLPLERNNIPFISRIRHPPLETSSARHAMPPVSSQRTRDDPYVVDSRHGRLPCSPGSSMFVLFRLEGCCRARDIHVTSQDTYLPTQYLTHPPINSTIVATPGQTPALAWLGTCETRQVVVRYGVSHNTISRHSSGTASRQHAIRRQRQPSKSNKAGVYVLPCALAHEARDHDGRCHRSTTPILYR